MFTALQKAYSSFTGAVIHSTLGYRGNLATGSVKKETPCASTTDRSGPRDVPTQIAVTLVSLALHASHTANSGVTGPIVPPPVNKIFILSLCTLRNIQYHSN